MPIPNGASSDWEQPRGFSMQFPDPKKLDFWLWAAVLTIVVGTATILLVVRWEPTVWQKPATMTGQPKNAGTGPF